MALRCHCACDHIAKCMNTDEVCKAWKLVNVGVNGGYLVGVRNFG